MDDTIRKDLFKSLTSYKAWNEAEEIARSQTLLFLQENDCFLGKKNTKGHITASAWLINRDKTKVLLTHHKVLDLWIQLGGHTDDGEHPLAAAEREAKEESGLKRFRLGQKELFDIDVHLFPAKKSQPAHYHYDMRYLFYGDDQEGIEVSSESFDVKWILLDEITSYTNEENLMRMVEKVRNGEE